MFSQYCSGVFFAYWREPIRKTSRLLIFTFTVKIYEKFLKACVGCAAEAFGKKIKSSA